MSQAVSLATPETLIKTSKDWVPLFIAYASAKSTAAEDMETDGPEADDTGAADEPSKAGDGVSLVSAIGGRCGLSTVRSPLFLISLLSGLGTENITGLQSLPHKRLCRSEGSLILDMPYARPEEC